jgi:mRNA interferase HigB
MHVLSEKKLREFWALHPDAEIPLRSWHRVAEQSEWEKFADVREIYPSADQVGKFTVFNVGGNKFRLIVVIHFNRGKLYVRHVLTHEDYDRGAWKRD